MKKPNLTVIIPAYHSEETIERAIDSIYGKSQFSIEILVVENGNDEKSIHSLERIISQYDDAIALLHSSKGVSIARNLGIKEAKGEFITFLDADDWLSIKELDKLIAFAMESDADIISGELYREYENKSVPLTNYAKEVRVFIESDKSEFEKDVFRIQKGACFACGKLFRTEFILENELLFREELTAAEDIEVMVRASYCAKKIACLPIYVYHYWYNPNSAVRKFREDYAQRYLASIGVIYAEICARKNAKDYLEPFSSFVLYHLLMISVNHSFHPQQSVGLRLQIAQYKKLLKDPFIKEAFEHVNYSDFSITRKIPLFCTKHGMILIVWMIAKIRQLQFRVMS